MNEQAAKANATQPAAAPVFNISVGDGVLDLFRPRAPVLDAPVPVPIPVTASHAVPMVFSPVGGLSCPPRIPVGVHLESSGVKFFK